MGAHMTLNEWLTLVAIIVGPIVAVAITLWVESRRRKSESRMVVARLLMATRHLPGDANYSTAINLIPIEFHDCKAVMTAFKEYGRQIRNALPDTEEGRQLMHRETMTAQTKLLSAVLQAMGMRVSEADLALEAYAAGGMIQRDNIYIESLVAQTRIARALEASLASDAPSETGSGTA